MTQTPGSSLAVELTTEPGGVTAAVTGDIDLATAANMSQAVLNALYRTDDGLLTLDLSGVGFCDSVGISALVDIRNTCTELGWRMRVIGLQHNVRRMIVDFTGLGEFLDVQ